ncbi:hypothetical protein HAX54_018590, partial [Datura stramonium]|nr:hypothetical protein [Datura stramonium]
MVDVVWSLFGDDSVKVEGEQDPVNARGFRRSSSENLRERRGGERGGSWRGV